MRKHLITLTYLASVFLSACTVYKIDIQQGNVITQDAINQLRPRMTPRQVRYVMGSPLITDAFHSNRWDYIYSYKPGGGERTQQRLSLFFNEAQELVGIQGDFRPNDVPLLQETGDNTVDVPPRVFEKSLSEKISDFFTWGDS